MLRSISVVVLLLAAACKTGEAPQRDRPSAAGPSPQATADKPAAVPGALHLGEPITEKPVALSDITKNPKAYEDKVVATSGTVFAVCQSMGCWMEIKDEATEAHVKLAGHKFFVPKTASGHTARVQARVIKTNADDECALEAAEQTGKPVAKLQLEATGVELD